MVGVWGRETALLDREQILWPSFRLVGSAAGDAASCGGYLG